MARRSALVLTVIFVSTSFGFDAASPIRYRFSFPEPQHRWMQVEATFPDLGSAALELRMSRFLLRERVENATELRIGRFEVCNRFFGIERKPAAAAVIDHGASVSYRQLITLRTGVLTLR